MQTPKVKSGIKTAHYFVEIALERCLVTLVYDIICAECSALAAAGGCVTGAAECNCEFHVFEISGVHTNMRWGEGTAERLLGCHSGQW